MKKRIVTIIIFRLHAYNTDIKTYNVNVIRCTNVILLNPSCDFVVDTVIDIALKSILQKLHY